MAYTVNPTVRALLLVQMRAVVEAKKAWERERDACLADKAITEVPRSVTERFSHYVAMQTIVRQGCAFVLIGQRLKRHEGESEGEAAGRHAHTFYGELMREAMA